MADHNNAHVPEPLRPFVEELAARAPEDRERVIAAAKGQRRRVLRAVPWDEVWKLNGIVSLGGDAVEDCDALFDEA